jgi:hypothetical protein
VRGLLGRALFGRRLDIRELKATGIFVSSKGGGPIEPHPVLRIAEPFRPDLVQRAHKRRDFRGGIGAKEFVEETLLDVDEASTFFLYGPHVPSCRVDALDDAGGYGEPPPVSFALAIHRATAKSVASPRDGSRVGRGSRWCPPGGPVAERCSSLPRGDGAGHPTRVGDSSKRGARSDTGLGRLPRGAGSSQMPPS